MVSKVEPEAVLTMDLTVTVKKPNGSGVKAPVVHGKIKMHVQQEHV